MARSCGRAAGLARHGRQRCPAAPPADTIGLQRHESARLLSCCFLLLPGAGLLMYLAPEQAANLLQTMAGATWGRAGSRTQQQRRPPQQRRAALHTPPGAASCDASLPVCLCPACPADLSPPGSVLIAHNATTELMEAVERGGGLYGPFRRDLVSTWRCGYPPAFNRAALAAVLQRGGWCLGEATSRARIAAAVCARGSDSSSGSGAGGGSSTSAAAAVGLGSAAVAEQVDFEARPDEGEDRWAVFFQAIK